MNRDAAQQRIQPDAEIAGDFWPFQPFSLLVCFLAVWPAISARVNANVGRH